MNEPNTSFSKQMRLMTRDVHKISDRLVNAKVGFALSDNRVWSEGLLIFYEIFKYLEDHVPGELLPIEFHRTAGFEADLNFYLGPEWKTTHAEPPRLTVQNYLDHLKELNEKQPILLIAYVYHLYMGLLSGGQILQKKRLLKNKLNIFNNHRTELSTPLGYSVTDFGETKICELKTKMRNLVDNLAGTLNDETQEAILCESREVFIWNNKIVRTIDVNSTVLFNHIAYWIVPITLLLFGIYLYIL